MIQFEWDEVKAQTNQLKHGIDFALAELVFEDPYHVSFISNVVEGEERWTAIGSVEGVIVLVVVHTYRERPPIEIVRIISARRATRKEKKLYEKTNG